MRGIVTNPLYKKKYYKELPIIFRTQTLVNFNGKTYLQVDGVSIKMPLRPAYANFI